MNASQAHVWCVGDKVKTNLEHAWIYQKTEKQNLMSRKRFGRVIYVPLATYSAGRGTLLVRWESLTGTPLKRSDFWIHSDIIKRCKA